MYQGLNNLNPKIAIVGSGAVGSYYGAKLAISGANVHFLMRSDLDHVRRFALRVESHETGTEHLNTVNAYESTEDIGQCDLVIIALKATDNHSLESIIPPLLKNDTVPRKNYKFTILNFIITQNIKKERNNKKQLR